MNKPTFNWVVTLTFASALFVASCSDDIDPVRDGSTDSVETGDASDADGGTEDGDGGASGDAAARMDGGAGGSDGGSSSPGGGSMSGGSMSGGSMSGGSMSGGSMSGGSMSGGSMSGGAMGGDGGGAAQSECAQRAKDECDYQKMCDPVGFAKEWDGDINQFCIPKRTRACEKGLAISRHRQIGDACNMWVRQSCDNYRNLYYPVLDTNGKWQYGSPACEAMIKGVRENRNAGDDCVADYQCKSGLFCKTANDNWMNHGKSGVERVCGKCAAQYAYDGQVTAQALESVEDVCYLPGVRDMCKSGYECSRAYGADSAGALTSLSFVRGTREDFLFCLKTFTKVGVDKPCAKESNIRCDDGLVCEPTTAGGIIGTCKVPPGGTVTAVVGKDARCDPAQCDKRLHLTCKPVQANGATENRCVQDAVVPIGGYCKNDAKADVATCSQFARCVESSGQCVRRNLENESCFANVTTPGANDRGSCDANVFDEQALVCRQDNGELSTHCHKWVPTLMCATNP